MEIFHFSLQLYSAISVFKVSFVMFELLQSFFTRKQRQKKKKLIKRKLYGFPKTHILFCQFSMKTERSLTTVFFLMAVLYRTPGEVMHTHKKQRTRNMKCFEIRHLNRPSFISPAVLSN